MPRKKASFAEGVKENIKGYINETTVHGFHYVAVSKNPCEVVLWLAVIFGGIIATAYMVAESFNEAYENPILTTIDTTSVKDVPFPAISVDAGKVTNSWGFIEKALDLVDFECYDDPYDCTNSSSLRRDFDGLFRAVIERWQEVLQANLDANYDIKGLEDLKNIEVRGFVSKFDEFEESVAILAYLKQIDSRSAKYVVRNIVQATADTLATASIKEAGNPLVRQYGKIIFYEPIIKVAAEEANITEAMIEDCLKNTDECPDETYKEAYIDMLTPFIVNRAPYRGLGFGQFMAYFTQKTVSNEANDENRITQQAFLSSKDMNYVEAFIESFLREVAKKMGGIDVSLYELAQLVDIPYYAHTNGERRQSTVIESEYGCNTKNYVSNWKLYAADDPIFMERLQLDKDGNTIKVREKEYAYEPLCRNETIVEGLSIAECCKLHDQYADAHETVMKVMKYAVQAPHFKQDRDEFKADFDRAEDYIDYQFLPRDKSPESFNPRIFMCQYSQEPNEMSPDNCKKAQFYRSFTNEGMGYSFNNGQFWNRHIRNEANELFYKIMAPEYNANVTDYLYPLTSGPAYGLTIVLQLNKYQEFAAQSDRSIEKAPKFKVAIHNPAMPADLRSGGVEVEAGYLSTFLITSSQLLTSEGVKGLEQSRRKCRFPSESEGLKIFKQYSQAGCIFECQIEHGLNKCGCIPWNYPHLGNLSKICDYMGSYCFEKVMASSEIAATKCECLYDCDTTRYAYSVSSTKLDIEEMCKKGSESQVIYGGTRFSLPLSFMRFYEQWVEGKGAGETDICKRNLPNVAIVQFQLASQIVTQIKRDMRVTFADTVSNFGTISTLFMSGY